MHRSRAMRNILVMYFDFFYYRTTNISDDIFVNHVWAQGWVSCWPCSSSCPWRIWVQWGWAWLRYPACSFPDDRRRFLLHYRLSRRLWSRIWWPLRWRTPAASTCFWQSFITHSIPEEIVPLALVGEHHQCFIVAFLHAANPDFAHIHHFWHFSHVYGIGVVKDDMPVAVFADTGYEVFDVGD